MWKKITEEKIHECIIEAYCNAGHLPINLHKAGAAVEEGKDILIFGKNEIAIAVKKAPKKKDIQQLEKLLDQKVKKRIYIYIDDPTWPFVKELKKYKTKLELWNVKALNEFLFKNESLRFINILFLNSPLYQNLREITYNFNKHKGVTPKRATKTDYENLWLLKDRTSMFKGLCKLLKFYFDEKISNKEPKEEVYSIFFKETIEELIKWFDWINNLAGNILKEGFIQAGYDNPSLISEFFHICKQRSGHYDSLLRDLAIGKKDDMEFYIDYHFVSNRNLDLSVYKYTHILDCINYLYEIAKDLEQGIDWVWQDSFK